MWRIGASVIRPLCGETLNRRYGGEFADSISGVSGVASVRIRTFDRASVVFDVDLAEPTALVARLQGRSPRLLRLLYANDRIIRLKLV